MPPIVNDVPNAINNAHIQWKLAFILREFSKVWRQYSTWKSINPEKGESCKSVGIGECSPIAIQLWRMRKSYHSVCTIRAVPPQIGPSRKGEHHIYQMAISRVKRIFLTFAPWSSHKTYTALVQVPKVTKTGQTLNITHAIAKRIV